MVKVLLASYVSAKNMLYRLNRNSNAEEVHYFIEFITLYPGGFAHCRYERFTQRICSCYSYAIEDELFIGNVF